jgi:hypothetical protein
MSAEPDVTRIVRSWLRTDEHESADRVLEHVLVLLDATPQRRTPWSARRIADMNSYAKLLVAAAAVAVVAVVGINLMPAGGSVGGGAGRTPTPAPTPTRSPSPSPTPAPTPVAFDWPRSTDLQVGTRYAWVVNGVPLSLAVPAAGWSTIGEPESTMTRTVDATADGGNAGSWFLIWDVDNVNSVPCTTTALATMPGPAAADLATAVASIPDTTVASGPSDVTVGGRPAKHLVLTLPDTLGCASTAFNLWYGNRAPACPGDPGPCWRYASEPGQTIAIWIVDAVGGRVFIEAETYKGTSSAVADEIQQVVDSIQFD